MSKVIIEIWKCELEWLWFTFRVKINKKLCDFKWKNSILSFTLIEYEYQSWISKKTVWFRFKNLIFYASNPQIPYPELEVGSKIVIVLNVNAITKDITMKQNSFYEISSQNELDSFENSEKIYIGTTTQPSSTYSIICQFVNNTTDSILCPNIQNFSDIQENNSTSIGNEVYKEWPIIKFLTLYYTPFMIVFGVMGNILSCLVFMNSRLRIRSSSYYLTALAITDITYLFVLLMLWLDQFGLKTFNSNYMCQVSFIKLWIVMTFNT